MTEPALSRGLALACFPFGVGASLAFACGAPCSCPQGLARPPESGALRIDLLRSAPAAALPPATPRGIEEGALEITEAELVLRYTSEGAQYEVADEIGEKLYP